MIRELYYTARAGLTLVGATAVAAPAAIVVSLGGAEKSDPVAQNWGRALVAGAGVQVELRGEEKLPPGTAVFVCNHQSLFDIPVIFAFIRRHIRFVAKKSLFSIPLFGPAMKASGNIMVDRTGGEHDRRTMSEAVEAVRSSVSILFFAEGTRSVTGELGAFKKGAFVLAIQAGVPVVPMGIWGTRDIVAKGSIWVHGGNKVGLVVGEPIPTAGRGIDFRDELLKQTRAEVERLMTEAKELAK